MQIEIESKQENPLLKRTEVEFVIHHQGEKTPERQAVRQMLAQSLGGDANAVVVDRMNSEYGHGATRGYAKLYKSAEDAKGGEPKHLLVRNGIIQEE